MKSISKILESKRREAYAKLKARFVKGLNKGGFASKTRRQQYYAIEKLKQLESQLNIRSTTRLKHWALALTLGFITLTASAQTASSVSFQKDEILGGGLFGYETAMADMDGDSDLDIISFHEAGPHRILYNDGYGNFPTSANIDPNTTGELRAFAIGDLDGDTDLDIFLGEYDGSSNSFRVLRNDGGSFSSYAAGGISGITGSVERIQIGRVDGDSDQDVIITSRVEGTYTEVFSNNGGFSFSLESIGPDLSYGHPVLGDFDGDGDLDIVITRLAYVTISDYRIEAMFYENYGTSPATFASTGVQSYLPSFNANYGSIESSIVAGMDNDSDQDLVLTYRRSYSENYYFGVQILTNNGSGSFTGGGNFEVTDPYSIGEEFNALDVDGDLLQDLLIHREGGGDSLKILLNSGGTLLESSQQFNTGFIYSFGSQTGDVDGDGDDDIVTINPVDVFVFDNEAGSFSPGPSIIEPIYAEDFQFADVDGDGDKDIVGAGLSQVLLNDGFGRFTLSQTLADSLGLVTGKVLVGDLNGDTHPDLVFAEDDLNDVNASIEFAINDGNGVFSFAAPFTQSSTYIAQPVLLDIDGDGDLDIGYFYGSSSYFFDYLQNDGSGGFTQSPGSWDAGSAFVLYNKPDHAVADTFDLDADLDIIFVDGTGSLGFVINYGGGNFGSNSATFGYNAQLNRIDVGDIDGDGNLDVIASNEYQGQTYGGYIPVFRNQGFSQISFDSPIYILNRGNPTADVELYDSDGDGNFDLVIFTDPIYGDDVWYNNSTPGTLSFTVDGTIGTYSERLDAADLDGDTDLDLFHFIDEVGNFISSNQSYTPNFPPDVEDQTFSIPENHVNTGVVGTVVASDLNGGDILNFSITGGNTGNTFAIGLTSGDITVSDSTLLDFETTPTWNLSVEVTDMVNTVPVTITVNLNDVDEAPIIADQSTSLNENPINGSAVYTVVASDPEGVQEIYSIKSGDPSGAFAINSGTGEITVADSAFIDFELNPAFTLVVEASDGSLTDSANVTITVQNLNELPVVGSPTFNINENPLNGMILGNVTAVDPEGVAPNMSIASGNVGNAFQINASTGQLSVVDSTAIDFEINPVFTLVIESTDGNVPGSGTVTVNIANINEAPAYEPGPFIYSLDENTPNATLIDTVSAVDQEGTALTYSISAGNTNGAFAIDPSIGAITVSNSAALDFETTPVFNLTVTVSDGPNFVNTPVTINLNDLTENAPPVMVDQNIEWPENTGGFIVNLTATDPDLDPLTFSIVGGNTAAAFALAANGDLSVNSVAAINFEANPVFNLLVRVFDGSSADTATVTFNIQNVNEAPVMGDQLFVINENSVAGTPAASPVATDPESDQISYGIVSGNTGNTFIINTTNGVITVSNPALLDFEVNPTFTLQVSAADGSLSDTATITINVADVNEAPDFEEQVFRVDELAANGSVIGTLKAFDAENNALTFSIVSGNTGNAFTLNAATGQLTVANNSGFDYDVQPDYLLNVEATDGEFTVSTVITVSLTTLERDRLALISLFNATGGTSWTQRTGWGSATLDNTWFGVTISNGRLVGLSLPSNGLAGDVPASFGDLTGLATIDLSGNQLSSFPDISHFQNTTSVNLSDNRLAFTHIIPNVEVPGINYSPQKRYGTTLDVTVDAGTDYMLTTTFPGTGNQYQWHFGPYINGQPFNNNVSPIPGATSSSYQIQDVDYSEMGTYRLVITNPSVPGLEISTRNRNILAQTDLFGNIIDGSGSAVNEGDVLIYEVVASGPFLLKDSTEIENNGSYAITDVTLGDYILLVRPGENATVLQTYYTSTTDWDQADTLVLREASNGVNIEMIDIPVPQTDPLGATLGGFIESDFDETGPIDEEGGRTLARRKVARAGCSMRKLRTAGRGLEDVYELEFYVESDDEGRFNFTGIPAGTYLLNIQYPGIPMDETSDIEFILTEDQQQQVFEAFALITEAGIEVEVDKVLSVPRPYVKDIEIYPNPTQGKLTMQYTVNRQLAGLNLEVYNITGVKLMERPLDYARGPKRLEIDLTNFGSGIYFVVFTDEEGTFRHQVKITKE